MGRKVYLYIIYDAYLRFSMSWRVQWTVAVSYLILGFVQFAIPAPGVRPIWVFWVSGSLWIATAYASLSILRREWNRERLGHDTTLSRLSEFGTAQTHYICMFGAAGVLWSKCDNTVLSIIGYTVAISIFSTMMLGIIGICVWICINDPRMKDNVDQNG